MAHKLDYLKPPKTETELRLLQDELYTATKDALAHKDLPRFKDLLEIISSEVTILTAIHNIKGNRGSQTPGSDGETMQQNILEANYPVVISRVQECLKDYHPAPVRRVYIPKPGKLEKRPLGIPTIIDRIIQECVRSVIEPILEAQFFAHSYGFRPMRGAQMAIERAVDVVHKTGYHWIIEGDISKFFDNVNHTRLIKKLWHMGIRDRRVLMIIKAMLKAGIMDELKENTVGTPQGGIISPLLANTYLNILDQWIIREWEEKETKRKYSTRNNARTALKRKGILKPAYLIRYADDWVLITSSKSNAEKWKRRIAKYLGCRLKLTLSEEKTCITNIRKKPIHFLGFTFKVIKGKSRTGWITRTNPDPEKLKSKVKDILSDINKLKRFKPRTRRGKSELINGINRINSRIRGIIQYYETATWVNYSLNKYNWVLNRKAYKVLKRHGGKWVPANTVNNLTSVHAKYRSQIPAIKYNELYIGLTSLAFCRWKKVTLKNQDETPYTKDGREKFKKRSLKKSTLARADELLSLPYSLIASMKSISSLYNFEFFLNRPYAFNRDKGKCRVCGKPLTDNIEIHHISPKLPMNIVNKIQNLASVHWTCHQMIHNKSEYPSLDSKIMLKIQDFRDKLDKLS